MPCKVTVELKQIFINIKNHFFGEDRYSFVVTVNNIRTEIPANNDLILIPNDIILPAGIGIDTVVFNGVVDIEPINLDIKVDLNEVTFNNRGDDPDISYGGFSLSNLSCKNMIGHNGDLNPFIINANYRDIDDSSKLDVTFNFIISIT